MTPSEEIDLLKRQIADLTDRVRLLEACSRGDLVPPRQPYMPYVPAVWPITTPQRDPFSPPWVTTCQAGGPQ